jgi:hypothetical protein
MKMGSVSGLRSSVLAMCGFAWLVAVDGCTFDSSQLRWQTEDSGVDSATADRAGGSPVDIVGVGGKDAGWSGYDAGDAVKDASAILTDAAFVDSSVDLLRGQSDAPPVLTETGGAGGGGDVGGSTFDASQDLPVITCSPVPKSIGGIACPGGVCAVGAYSGSAFVSNTTGSTFCLSSNCVCAAGPTPQFNATVNNWGADFGFNLSPNSTSTNLIPVQLVGKGVSVTLSNLPSVPVVRINVLVGGTSYCATIATASQTIPWTSFNSSCWDDTGSFLSGNVLNAATSLYFVINSTSAGGTFDFCVTSISFPGSETCSTGYHDDGTGTCVLAGACATGFHDDGTGTCSLAGTCAAGHHDGGTGTCVLAGTCSTGYHDGGNGTCVQTGTCSAGYNNCSGTCSASSCALPLGTRCLSGAQCKSTYCTDGVCCESASCANACATCSGSVNGVPNGQCGARCMVCNCTNGDCSC